MSEPLNLSVTCRCGFAGVPVRPIAGVFREDGTPHATIMQAVCPACGLLFHITDLLPLPVEGERDA